MFEKYYGQATVLDDNANPVTESFSTTLKTSLARIASGFKPGIYIEFINNVLLAQHRTSSEYVDLKQEYSSVLKPYLVDDLELVPVSSEMVDAYELEEKRPEGEVYYFVRSDADVLKEFFVLTPLFDTVQGQNFCLEYYFIKRKKAVGGTLEQMRCDQPTTDCRLTTIFDEESFTQAPKHVDDDGGISYVPTINNEAQFIDQCKLIIPSGSKPESFVQDVDTSQLRFPLSIDGGFKQYYETNTPKYSEYDKSYNESSPRVIFYRKLMSNIQSGIQPRIIDQGSFLGESAAFSSSSTTVLSNTVAVPGTMPNTKRKDTAGAMNNAILQEVDTIRGNFMTALHFERFQQELTKHSGRRFPATLYFKCMAALGRVPFGYVFIKQEWSHLIGHGEGGPESDTNLVCASHYANTIQLAIEEGIRSSRTILGHEISRLRIKVSAVMFPRTHYLAKWIRYEISLGHQIVFSHTYDGQCMGFDRNEFRILKLFVTRAILQFLSGTNDLWVEYCARYPLEPMGAESGKYLMVEDTALDPAYNYYFDLARDLIDDGAGPSNGLATTTTTDDDDDDDRGVQDMEGITTGGSMTANSGAGFAPTGSLFFGSDTRAPLVQLPVRQVDGTGRAPLSDQAFNMGSFGSGGGFGGSTGGGFGPGSSNGGGFGEGGMF